MRIGVSGAHGVGKTTLVEALCDHLAGHSPVEEPYLLLEEEGYAFAHPPVVEDYWVQFGRSVQLLRSPSERAVFDRTPLDFLAYLLALGADIGTLDGAALRVAIVVSRFNELITEKLRDGAVSTALECGVPDESIDIVWVPGAFELPMAARWLAESGEYDAIACVGAVIRGETPHFDFVAGEAARGIAEVAREWGLPVTFGVITSDNLSQAQARAGGTVGNKGREAMLAAIEMATLRPLLQA